MAKEGHCSNKYCGPTLHQNAHGYETVLDGRLLSTGYDNITSILAIENVNTVRLLPLLNFKAKILCLDMVQKHDLSFENLPQFE